MEDLSSQKEGGTGHALGKHVTNICRDSTILLPRYLGHFMHTAGLAEAKYS